MNCMFESTISYHRSDSSSYDLIQFEIAELFPFGHRGTTIKKSHYICLDCFRERIAGFIQQWIVKHRIGGPSKYAIAEFCKQR